MSEHDPLISNAAHERDSSTMTDSNPRRRSSRFWMYFILPLVIVLIALLAYGPYEPVPPFDNVVPAGNPRTALLLTAHPDDEAMFFSPTILQLIAQGWEVRGLCLSVGKSSFSPTLARMTGRV